MTDKDIDMKTIDETITELWEEVDKINGTLVLERMYRKELQYHLRDAIDTRRKYVRLVGDLGDLIPDTETGDE